VNVKVKYLFLDIGFLNVETELVTLADIARGSDTILIG